MSNGLIVEEREAIKAAIMPMQWRVFVFNKGGRSFKGEMLYPELEAAQKRIQLVETNMKAGTIDAVRTQGGMVLSVDYHYAMPMPELL